MQWIWGRERFLCLFEKFILSVYLRGTGSFLRCYLLRLPDVPPGHIRLSLSPARSLFFGFSSASLQHISHYRWYFQNAALRQDSIRYDLHKKPKFRYQRKIPTFLFYLLLSVSYRADTNYFFLHNWTLRRYKLLLAIVLRLILLLYLC